MQSAKKLILRVDQLQLVNQTCASVRPAQKPVAVVGEVGEGQMAVPGDDQRKRDKNDSGFSDGRYGQARTALKQPRHTRPAVDIKLCARQYRPSGAICGDSRYLCCVGHPHRNRPGTHARGGHDAGLLCCRRNKIPSESAKAKIKKIKRSSVP